MKYIALNHSTKAAFDLHEGRWKDVMQVHPNLVAYRAKRENLPDTLAGAIHDRNFSELGDGLDSAVVTLLASRLAVFGIEVVYDRDTAINRYPQYLLVGSCYDDMQARIEENPGLRLVDLLENNTP